MLNCIAISPSELANNHYLPRKGFYFVSGQQVVPILLAELAKLILHYTLAFIHQSLNNLSEQAFLQLRRNGALPVIYAHLFSLNRIERIKNLAQQKQNIAQKQQKPAAPKAVVDLEDNIFRFDI